VEADFTNRVVDIVHEGFDLAVRVGPLSDSSLAARRLGRLGYGLYAAPDHLRRQG
jgi:DNA-binding transcriptional LysR family regulator